MDDISYKISTNRSRLECGVVNEFEVLDRRIIKRAIHLDLILVVKKINYIIFIR